MSRFFTTKENIQNGQILIYGDDVSHIRNVLRAVRGDRFTVCDGEGMDYLVEIEKLDSREITARIVEIMENSTEPPVALTLFQGIPKSDKMDFVIQKSVELGVHRIVPVVTERTVVRFHNAADGENKAKRWQKIALEAAKQCDRGRVPEVTAPVDFDKALAIARQSQLAIIPYEKEVSVGLENILDNRDVTAVSIIIGPEGGFAESEVNAARSCGIFPVTLGPRILRTDTAALAVISIVMHRLGDIGASKIENGRNRE